MRTSWCTRPSKLRLPESTADTDSLLSCTALPIGSFSGPELPMHVVQPYATTWKPRCSRSSIRPAFFKYSVTARDPGASEVLTQGCDFRPSARALRASRPAPISTDGLEVLVHEVMAAMTTAPSFSSKLLAPSLTLAGPADGRIFCSASKALRKLAFTSGSSTRSCGRLGPASDGLIE